MGKKKRKSSANRKGKKQRAPSTKIKKGTMYSEKEGKVERKSLSCPKCGPGIFLAQHKDRSSCGNCGYTSYKAKEK